MKDKQQCREDDNLRIQFELNLHFIKQFAQCKRNVLCICSNYLSENVLCGLL